MAKSKEKGRKRRNIRLKKDKICEKRERKQLLKKDNGMKG